MTVDQILPRLHGVRRCGSGWIALCPAHRDRSPSLSIAERGGRILLHCFAGCARAVILAGLGLTSGDLWPARRITPEEKRRFDSEKRAAAKRENRLLVAELVARIRLVEETHALADLSLAACAESESWWGWYAEQLERIKRVEAERLAARAALGDAIAWTWPQIAWAEPMARKLWRARDLAARALAPAPSAAVRGILDAGGAEVNGKWEDL